MNPKVYCIISETTEDRFDEAASLKEAIRIARALARESQAGDPISIEHRGRVIRQLVLLPDGKVLEEEIHCLSAAACGLPDARKGPRRLTTPTSLGQPPYPVSGS